jgi:hypothetical protein
MRSHKRSALQFAIDDHITADCDALAGDNGVNCVELFAKVQVPALIRVYQLGIDRARRRQPLPPCRSIWISTGPFKMN